MATGISRFHRIRPTFAAVSTVLAMVPSRHNLVLVQPCRAPLGAPRDEPPRTHKGRRVYRRRVPDPGFRTPPGVAWLRDSADGRAWLTALPALLDEVAARWRLTLGEPFPYTYASGAVPVRTGDGTHAVLKLQFPDRESEHEGTALRAWAGRGAVRLLAEDQDRHALLLERCEPGHPLFDAPAAELLDVLAGLLPRLWIPPPPGVGTLSEEAARWLAGLEAAWARTGRELPRALLHEAVLALEELPDSQGEAVLLNQDLHTKNVLQAQREPWLVIDPKPLAGEREFALAPVLRSIARRDLAEPVPALDRLSAGLGLDRERARRWTLVQAVAWGFDGDRVDPLHAVVADLMHRA